MDKYKFILLYKKTGVPRTLLLLYINIFYNFIFYFE